MEKLKIRPLATPKPLNRLSLKVTHMTTSWISTHKQNLVTIPQGVSFPRMREISRHTQVLFSGFFQWPAAQAPEPIFTQDTSNDVLPRKDVPFRSYKTNI